MSKNAGKYFLKGFQPNFENSYSNSFRYGKREQENEYNLEQKRLEEERKAAEKQKSMETVNRLLNNGISGQTLRGGKPYFVSDDKNTQMRLASTLPASELNRYQDLKKMFETKQEKTKYVYKENSPTAFIEDEEGRLTPTEEPNPTYRKKVKTTTKGEIDGLEATQIFYEDGTDEIIKTVFKSNDKRVKRTAINNNLKTINNIKKLKELYLESEGDETARRYVNSLTNETREKVYLQLNDKQKEFIDVHYNDLKNTYKSKGYKTLEEYESDAQDGILSATGEIIYDAVDDNAIEWEDAQGLLNYFELKYGYLR